MFEKVLIILGALNVITYLMVWFDKHQARYHARRIPENLMLGLSLIGGSLGTRVAMAMFSHKTRKSKFSTGVTVMLFCHILLLGGIWTLMP